VAYCGFFKKFSDVSEVISIIDQTFYREFSTVSEKFRQNHRIDTGKIILRSKVSEILESFGIINPVKCNILPKKSFLFPEKIIINPIMSEYFIGKIENSTGKIDFTTGLIDEDTGLITETDDTKHTANGRRSRSKERGKDSKPRNFPLHTMKNLPQFRNKSHEEFRQHILETKGVDIGGNINFGKMALWVLIGLVIVAGGIGIWEIYQQYQNRQEAKHVEITDDNTT